MQNQYTAKTLYGLEEILAQELKSIGAEKIEKGVRAVHFYGNLKLLYKANLACRTALKFLEPIEHFRARDEKQLYEGIYRMDWSEYLQVDQTLAIDATCSSTYFTHSKYLALKCKDAIVDQFRNREGRRPGVDLTLPDLRLHLHVQDDLCTISRDSSGASLHLRGYKTQGHLAPMNEVLAAGMLLLAGWKGQSNFLDPMCGSGTLLVEADFIARNKAPNLLRKDFAFMRWADYDAKLFEEVRNELQAAEHPFEFTIEGRDKDFSSVKKTRFHAQEAGCEEIISTAQDFFTSVKTGEDPLFIAFNPPYDERINIATEQFYRSIGDTLKRGYANSEAWIITANQEALKQVGLKPKVKLKLFNGPLEARLVGFELYAGSRKTHLPKEV
ncbi:MAG: RNA methyltransferase [Chitinophagaceae bacterium]|nr:RNA methyltransferase [Chitinophagaceae bacterium]